MQNPTSVLGAYSALAKDAVGIENELRLTGFRSMAVAQVEPQYANLAAAGRLFVGGISVVAGAIVPVVDLPTTTAPLVIFNNDTAGSTARNVVLLRVSCMIGSGTIGAAGFSIFAGVTPAPLANAQFPVANATNTSIQNCRGPGAATSRCFIKPAVTVPSGTFYTLLDGLMTTNVAVTGCGKGVDVGGAFIAQPGYAICLGAYGDTGTTAKFIIQALWAELEADFGA